MDIVKSKGFTIIEVMLFLAVTGALAVAILVGSGVAIGQQRYRDSVNSLQSFIQSQYTEVKNITNDRSQAWTCDSTGTVTNNITGTGQPRGTSDCVLLGRLITVDSTGRQLSASNVVGYASPNAVDAASDILELQTNYKLSISPIDQDSDSVSWGAQVVKPKTTTPMAVTMLIIHSPLSGAVIAFTATGAQTDPNSMVTAANMSRITNLCINADTGTFVGSRLAVQIGAYATNQGSIQIPPGNENICD
jgi:type II secretory pathway pseudopilin PulG